MESFRQHSPLISSPHSDNRSIHPIIILIIIIIVAGIFSLSVSVIIYYYNKPDEGTIAQSYYYNSIEILKYIGAGIIILFGIFH